MGSRSHETDRLGFEFIIISFDILLFIGILLTDVTVQCDALIAGISGELLVFYLFVCILLFGVLVQVYKIIT